MLLEFIAYRRCPPFRRATAMSFYGNILLAVAMVALTATNPLAEEDHAKEAQGMEIKEVLDRQRELLMSRPHAVGVGIGLHHGKPAIVFMIDEETPDALTDLPKEIEGFPVIVETVGEIKAFDDLKVPSAQ